MTTAQPWITLEGVNGVGKSYLARRVVEQLGDLCVPLVELPDSVPGLLPGRIIEALQAGGDPFLRTGCPRTETLLLAALQVHRHETVTVRASQVVLEDRGPHSVAVYQAAILGDDHAGDDETFAEAQALGDLIARWRPLPSRTILLLDDPAGCRRRFEERLGRQARPSELRLMERVARLYDRFVASLPHQFEVLDRRVLDADACADAIGSACRQAAGVSEGTG
jgi:dTMP kinase